jgi:hypothetical protein
MKPGAWPKAMTLIRSRGLKTAKAVFESCGASSRATTEANGDPPGLVTSEKSLSMLDMRDSMPPQGFAPTVGSL